MALTPMIASTVSVIIPALDEERSIGPVLDAIPRDVVGEIIVVDGGSRDATVRIARARGALVLHEPRRGYGRACARGVCEAGGEVVVFLDADGANDPRDIRALVAPIAEGRADMVLGSRRRPGHSAIAPGAMPFQQRVGNRLGAFLIRALHGLPVTDLAPFRAVRRELLLALRIENLTFGWPTEMIVMAARARWRIVEVPVACGPRTGGSSKISGTLRGTMLAAVHILGTIIGSARPGWRILVDAPLPGAPNRTAPIVVIMAKQPVAGSTKTRLCPPLTLGEAAELYEVLLRDTVSLVSAVPGIEVAIAVTPPAGIEPMQALAPRGARILAVTGADIGECLRSTIGRLFSDGFTRVVAINSDGPTLPAAYIERAAELLRDTDVVLGPADDGGYYLIGLRQPHPALFEGVSWSTAHVAAQTRERAAALGLSVAQLPSWYDVDTPADLARLRADLGTLPADVAPFTRELFARRAGRLLPRVAADSIASPTRSQLLSDSRR